MLLNSPTTEASQHHSQLTNRLQGVSVFLCFLRPPFSASVSFPQMWMSVRSLQSVSTATVSIWKAPTSAPVTMVTKSHQTAKTVKVCKGLCRAVGCNSPLHTSQLVERRQNNVCALCLPARCQRVCGWECVPCRDLHQHCGFLHLPELQAWVWTIC